jgi:hypothetical protein
MLHRGQQLDSLCGVRMTTSGRAYGQVGVIGEILMRCTRCDNDAQLTGVPWAFSVPVPRLIEVDPTTLWP